ncbi:MAG: hypothetical protein HN350_18835 [Phycisphaerales bacterium]|jgi:hypothetical protein|nr:hypothetical protein [Phycisphaerales bacterium]
MKTAVCTIIFIAAVAAIVFLCLPTERNSDTQENVPSVEEQAPEVLRGPNSRFVRDKSKPGSPIISIQRLYLPEDNHQAVFAALKSMTSLRSINVNAHRGLTDADIRTLESLEELRELRM